MSAPPPLLTGLTAAVSGAAGGIGHAVARLFAQHGARVALLDLNETAGEHLVSEIAAEGGEALFLSTDMTRPHAVEAALQRVIENWGRLDVMVNVAGGSGRRWGDGPVGECSLEGWQHTLELNLTTTFLGCKYAVQHMQQQDGGCIINVSSVLGLVGGDADFATHAYSASKGGIISLTRAMAVFYAPQHIRVNVICPGLIATAMSQRAQASFQIRARLPELHPLTSDFGKPEDVAHAALFLAAPQAGFVTGTVLTVDGGWTAH